MANPKTHTSPFAEQYNPFDVVDNSEILKINLEEIEKRNIRSKFKQTEDPINYVFDCFDNTPLNILAVDFVKEGFSDIVSFISRICK